MTKDFVSPHVSASVDGPEVIELGLVAVLGSLAVEGAGLLSEHRTSLASGAGLVFADSLVSGHNLSETAEGTNIHIIRSVRATVLAGSELDKLLVEVDNDNIIGISFVAASLASTASLLLLGKSCLSLSVTLGFAFLAVSLGKSSVNGKRVYPSA